MRRNVSPNAAHALHHRDEISVDTCGQPHAELTRLACVGSDLCAANESFRGDTTDIQTVAPHQVLFNERYLRPDTRRACGGDQPGRASADDHEVVAGRGSWVDPVRGMDACDERLIVLVPRFNATVAVRGLRRGHERLNAARVFSPVPLDVVGWHPARSGFARPVPRSG